MKPFFFTLIVLGFYQPRLVSAISWADYSFTVPSIENGQKLEYDNIKIGAGVSSVFGINEVIDKLITYPICVSPINRSLAADYLEPYPFGMSVQYFCNVVNPVFISGVRIELNYSQIFHTPEIIKLKELPVCRVKIDLNDWSPLPESLDHLFDPKRNDKLEIINIALRALEKNAYGPIVDCKIQYKGLDKHADLYGLSLPDMLLPVIDGCHLLNDFDKGNRKDAIHSNRMGMEYYRARRYQEAITYFSKAINLDCRYFIAYTNLASTLALERQYYKSLAVLARAKERDPMLTLRKLLLDSDYRIMLKETLGNHNGYYLTEELIDSICPNILKDWHVGLGIVETKRLLERNCKDTINISSISTAVVRVGGPGSCLNYEFMLDKNGDVDRTQPLTVIRQGAALYVDATSDNLVQAPSFLNFNKKIKAIALKGSRIQVKLISGDDPLGWVERSDLLCTLRPARGQSGLEKKLYIKTATAVQGSITAVNAYPSPGQSDCPTGGCRQLSRFKGYFIFDEEQGRYLLSDEYNLKDSSPLVGWVDKKDGTLWETAYGLRPRVEGTICAYRTLTDAKTKRRCLSIPGGNRWFTYPDRIPVLSKDDEYYKVLLPATGDSVSIGVSQSDDLSSIDKVIEAYIPISEDIAVDVWLKTEDLERWKRILSMFEGIGRLNSTKQRTAFVISLTENLRQVLKGIYKNDQSLRDYIESRVISLPLRDNSPLFSYSYDNLMDKEQVPDCEISQLINWVNNSKQMLDIVSLGTRRPVYTKKLFPDNCSRADGSKNSIPHIDGAIEQEPLGSTDDYRYDHVFQKVKVFWVPIEFLP